MTINRANTSKNVVELRKELTENGTSVENIYVDGQKFCCFGYTSERDKEAGLKAIQAAIDGSENIYEAMQKLMTNANLTDKNVEPDEEVEINGMLVYISYADKTVYDSNGEEIVNCQELECELPPEACKTILMQKLELATTEADEEDLW